MEIVIGHGMNEVTVYQSVSFGVPATDTVQVKNIHLRENSDGSQERQHFISDKEEGNWKYNLLSIQENCLWRNMYDAFLAFLIIKANEIHYLSTLFGKELYMFRADLLSIIKVS